MSRSIIHDDVFITGSVALERALPAVEQGSEVLRRHDILDPLIAAAGLEVDDATRDLDGQIPNKREAFHTHTPLEPIRQQGLSAEISQSIKQVKNGSSKMSAAPK